VSRIEGDICEWMWMVVGLVMINGLAAFWNYDIQYCFVSITPILARA